MRLDRLDSRTKITMNCATLQELRHSILLSLGKAIPDFFGNPFKCIF